MFIVGADEPFTSNSLFPLPTGGQAIDEFGEALFGQTNGDIVEFGSIERLGMTGGRVAADNRYGRNDIPDRRGLTDHGIGFAGQRRKADDIRLPGGRKIKQGIGRFALTIENAHIMLAKRSGQDFQAERLAFEDSFQRGNAVLFLGNAAAAVRRINKQNFQFFPHAHVRYCCHCGLL